MSDSGTDDEMLIIRQQQQNGPDPQRAARCYTRGFILALSRSDKVACPPGMKPLKQWYGDYEPPQGTGNGNSNGNNTGNSTGLLRYGALSNGGVGGRGDRDRDQQGGSRRGGDRDSRGDRDRDRNGTAAGREGGSERDRYGGDTSRGGSGTKAESASSSGTPTATGAMGDFRLPGSRPALNLRDSEDGPRRRGGDAAAKDRGERELRPWSSTTPTSATAISGETGAARRTLGGDFVKKDGRAAEEGGWRSNREPATRGGDRFGDRNDRNSDRADRDRRTMGNDRDGNRDRNGERSGLGDRGDRRRQPAWMDSTDNDSGSGSGARQSNEPMGPGSGFPGRRLPGRERDRGDDSSSYSRRDGHAFREQESSVPEWMASSDDVGDGALESGSNGRGLEDALEPEDIVPKKQEKVQHVDSIQAWKAEMKEIERKKRLQSEKELRREMGLADLTDAELQRKLDIRDGKVDPNEQVQAAAPVPVKAPAKSVFADFLLSAPAAAAADSSAQDKQGGTGTSTTSTSGADGKTEGKPRSSRFARFFDAQGNQTSGPVASPDAPSHQSQAAQPRSTQPQPQPQSQSQSQSPAPALPSGQNLLAALLPGVDTSAPRAGPTSADAQSMMRLMEMLQMSSAGPTPAAAKSPDQRNGQAQLSGLPEQQQHRMPQASRGLPPPASQQLQHFGEAPRRSASSTRQSPPMALNNGMFSPNPQPQVAAPPPRNPSPQQQQQQQSRLAHRMSGASAQGLAPPPAQHQQQPQPQPQPQSQSRRDFAAPSPQPGPGADPRGSAGITSPQGHHILPTHMHQLPPPALHGGVRSPMPGLPQHGNGNGNGNVSEQQQAQMAAFLAAQLGQGQAAARLPPKQQQQQPQQPGQMYPGQDQHQQLQHFMNAAGQSRGIAGHAHGRSPSGSFPAGQVPGPQQQPQQAHHFPGQQQQQHGRGQPADDLLRSLAQHQLPPHLAQHQPLPPPPQQQYAPPPPAQFAQQNALAQFLAQGGHPNANFGGPASHPLPPPQSQSQQQQVPPPQARQYQVPGPQYQQQQHFAPHQPYMQPQPQHQPQQHHQPMPQQLQQSQIDLMALLTAASRR